MQKNEKIKKNTQKNEKNDRKICKNLLENLKK